MYTRKKFLAVPLCPPQIPHGLAAPPQWEFGDWPSD